MKVDKVNGRSDHAEEEINKRDDEVVKTIQVEPPREKKGTVKTQRFVMLQKTQPNKCLIGVP